MKIYKFNGRCNVTGEAIKRLRQREKWSQAQLAAKMQVENVLLEQKAISRIEQGERIVTDYELVVFSKIFHVDVRELLGIETE